MNIAYICSSKINLFIMKLGTGEIILILAALLLLFGGKKIPELMKGLGKGMKEFKDASKGEESPATTTDKTEKK
jgi:sec-independent protein translocase protein TatA